MLARPAGEMLLHTAATGLHKPRSYKHVGAVFSLDLIGAIFRYGIWFCCKSMICMCFVYVCVVYVCGNM